MKTDMQLQRDVFDELQWEPSIDAAEIGVSARAGVVTLTGVVTNYGEKLAAERVVKRIRGVKAVANDIEVRPRGTGAPSDTDIAQAALLALKWKTFVPASRIQVSVSQGWVTLEGQVDWHYQKSAAEDAVRHLIGVRGVIDEIAIRPKVSAAQVKDRIEEAIKRSAELDAKRIGVETLDGKVTLKGEVHTWSERQEAERTAWSAPGVTQVENLISITPRSA